MSPTVYTTSQPLLHKRSVGTAEIPACPSAPSSSLYHSSPLCRQVTKPTRNCLFSSSTEYKPPSSSAGQAKLSSAPLAPQGFYSPVCSAQGQWGIPAALPSESPLFGEQMETGVPCLVEKVPSVHTAQEAMPTASCWCWELSATEESHPQQQIRAVPAWNIPLRAQLYWAGAAQRWGAEGVQFNNQSSSGKGIRVWLESHSNEQWELPLAIALWGWLTPVRIGPLPSRPFGSRFVSNVSKASHIFRVCSPLWEVNCWEFVSNIGNLNQLYKYATFENTGGFWHISDWW